MKKLFLSILITISVSNLFATDFIGHSSKITDTTINNNLLYSISEIGLLKIWDLNGEKIIFSTNISNLNLTKIEIDKKGTTAAIIESDNIGNYNLVLWNLKKNRLIKRIRLPQAPLSMQFSQNSRILSISLLDYNSLLFIDTKNGANKIIFPKGPDIVDEFFYDQKSNRILAYSSSGYIYDINLDKNSITKKIRTLANLKYSVIFEGAKYMAAYKSDYLMVINLTNGKIARRFSTGNVQSIDVSTKFLLSYTVKDGDYTNVGVWSIQKSNSGNIIYNSASDITSLTMSDSLIVIANDKFEINILKNGKISTMKNITSTEILDIASDESNVVIINKENIFMTDISKKLISKKAVFENKFKSDCSIFNIDGQFIICENRLNNPRIALLNVKTGEFENIKTIKSAIKKIDNGYALLQDDSLIKLNAKNLSLDEESKISGIQDFVKIGNNIIACDTAINPSLFNIDLQSNESYKINFDFDNLLSLTSVKNKIYITYLKENDLSVETIISKLDIKYLDESSEIFKSNKEILTAKLLNVNNKYLYSILEDSELYKINKKKFSNADKSLAPINKLYSYKNFILSLNYDYTLTVWDSKKGEIINNIYIDKNFEIVSN